MKNCKFASAIFCICMCVPITGLQGQVVDEEVVALGPWLQEGTGSVTGSGDTFTATPLPAGIADTGDNFEERNLARHRVYQTFGPVDVLSLRRQACVTFDVTFAGTPNSIDAGFRMSLISFRADPDQGLVPIAFDTGARSGAYNQAQLVSDAGDAEAGMFNDAFKSSSTIAVSAAAPTINNGANDLGLIDGNTLRFEVVMRRRQTNYVEFNTKVTEANGDVVYEETSGAVADSSSFGGLDAIVFGIFDDTPFAAGGSYTVSGLTITTSRIPLLGDVDRDESITFLDIAPFIAVLRSGVYQVEADVDQSGVVDFLDIYAWICILAGQEK